MNQAKIGKFLAELRKENGMTQEQLAEKLNVAQGVSLGMLLTGLVFSGRYGIKIRAFKQRIFKCQ